jgi:heme/copper-type cytochrome/quinol oxidase subunit 4
MEVVGVVEIAAGILTLARPRIGGFVVMAWLTCIAFSLVAGGRYLDVAVRDLVMAIGAFTLANLSAIITNTNQRRPL